MKKQLLLSAVALVVGLSACNDETLPTEGQGNLLKNPPNTTLLEDSEYGMGFEDFYSLAPGDTIKAVPPYVPVDSLRPYLPGLSRPGNAPGYVHISTLETGDWSRYKPTGTIHISEGSDKTKYGYPGTRHISEGDDRSRYTPPNSEHVKEGENKSRYKPANSVHIEDEHNRSKYKPAGTEHIKEGANKSQYKPVNWVHFGGPPSIDNTKYLPPGYEHIAKGENESKYYKPASNPAGQ
jgi:hypothetical protein